MDINFDISSIEYDENGVKNFYWPLDRTENVVVRDFLICRIAKMYGKSVYKNDFSATNFAMFFKWFLCQTLRIFEAISISNTLLADNIKPQIPKHFHFLNAAFNEEDIKCKFFLKNCNGPETGMKVPRAIKKIVREAQWNGFQIKKMFLENSAEDIFCIAPSKLVIRHARAMNRSLRYGHICEWIHTGLDPSLLIENESLGLTEFNREILKTVEQAFVSGGVVLSAKMREYLRAWLSHQDTFANFFISLLNGKKDKLPHILWLSSAATSIWKCLLSVAVRQNGGYVVSHAHGSPNPNKAELAAHYSEFVHVDEFFAFGRFAANDMEKGICKKMLFGQPAPKITSLDDFQEINQVPLSKTPVRIKRKIRRVMYVSTAFHGEGARFRPILSDMTYFDWQARLLGKLKSQKFEVLYKPHPEGRSKPPRGFSKFYGYKTIWQNFEDVKEDIDAYIIDFNSSSTTSHIFRSQLPIVFIDPGYPELTPDAKKLFSKRCYYIETVVDKNNRMNINWKELYSALDREEHEFFMDYTALYYRNI